MPFSDDLCHQNILLNIEKHLHAVIPGELGAALTGSAPCGVGLRNGAQDGAIQRSGCPALAYPLR